jgi:hypothetical protein
MNSLINWHRRIWSLQKVDDDNFYRSGASNQFWLEPSTYGGPAVTVPASGAVPITQPTTYTQNMFCFRVQFLEGAMTDSWRDLVLFATGTEPFVGGTDPQPTDDTQRIENVVQVPPPPTVLEVRLRAFLTTAQPAKLYLHIEYQGGGDGWVHST